MIRGVILNISDIERLFEHYGYFVLLVGLFLEFIALPFPGETTLTYSGFLIYKGILNPVPVFIIAYLATTMGMTLTYGVGYKLGLPFLKKYGKWIFFSEAKLNKTKRWFDRYGTGLLFIGYFIPGVRHFTGYFSGLIRIPFRAFALYTYAGAAFWVFCFVTLGYICGPEWQTIFHSVEKNAWKLAVIFGGVVLLYIALKLLLRSKKAVG